MNNKNELLKRLIITLILLCIERIGIFIPILNMDHTLFYSATVKDNFINFLNIFSGGGLATVGIFALGITPYINASIFIQLLTKIIPQLENLQKEGGEAGRLKITQIIRYSTLAWAILQSLAISVWVKPYVFNWNIQFIFDCVLTLSVGSLTIMWLSELITEHGIGNGPSLLIFQNIIVNIPQNFKTYIGNKLGSFTNIESVISVAMLFFMLIITVLIQEGTRKVAIISYRQLNSSAIDTTSYIPLKLNQGGVMPIVFASTAMTIPSYLQMLFKNNKFFAMTIGTVLSSSYIYFFIYGILIVAFSYFYTSLILDTEDLAGNLKKMGASIPGVRPGKTTGKYLKKILDRLTFLGSILLFLLALFPSIITHYTSLTTFQGISATSLLILVGVGIDTTKQIQTCLITQKYNNMIK